MSDDALLKPTVGSAPAALALAPDSAARRLISALVERDVTVFFGIPGGPVCPIFEAIRLEPRARLIESRHENHAGFAAALYHRTTGDVPAVVVTCGPGITNGMSGIASARLERVPMLVIMGDVAWASTGGRLAQDSGPHGIDAESILRSVTSARFRALRPHNAVSMGIAALEAATNPADPGPALLVMPLDVSRGACRAARIAPRPQPVLPDPDPSVVDNAVRTVAGAERPLLVLGPQCHAHPKAARECVEALGAPFITTPRAKGVVPETHPLSLRTGGIAASMWARAYAKRGIDACIVVGTDLNDAAIGPVSYVKDGGALFHFDTDPSAFGSNVATAYGVIADAGSTLRALTAAARSGPHVGPQVRDELRAIRTTSPFDVPGCATDAHDPVQPHRLLKDLEAAVPADARFTSDIGEHMLFCLHYLTARASDSFAIQIGLGSMGSGIAGAIGMALGDPSRPVVCIAGDGGMHMAGMEALVALRERLPVLFVVMNDARYTMVHLGMAQIFGDAQPYDTPFVDFSAWAAALGMPSAVVRSPGALTKELVSSLMASGGPALIDARIDASVRVSGGGRVEALQHMSMLQRGAGDE